MALPGMMQTQSSGRAPLNLSGYTAKQANDQYGHGLDRLKGATIAAGDQAQTSDSNQTQSRNGFLDMLNQDPTKELSAYIDASMGSFNKSIQQQRESSVSRGIGTGDLGTSYEGDIDSAFMKDIAGKAADLYSTRLGAEGQLYGQDSQNNANTQNRYLDAITGVTDSQQASKDSKNSFLGGILNTVGSVAGKVLKP